MKTDKHIRFYILVAALFVLLPSTAMGLSDDEAYSRAYTVCSQKVYPLWRSKEGEAVNKDDYALTPPRLRKIAACMREKGVPAAFDAETLGVVRTGAGFGENVEIKIEDLFPDDITAPKENPHKTNKNILPDPDYFLSESVLNDTADHEVIDTRLMRSRESGDAANRERAPFERQPVRPETTGGVITGKAESKNDRNGKDNKDNNVKPIFLPR